ncbi:uncharacterized protein LOC135400220 [Ornithodoros turicata]|uniref:uncharacterized protein LOC135400220 n=1 Tax=Ornithodoros turicata TaxID=34597 RepID=UPI003139B756
MAAASPTQSCGKRSLQQKRNGKQSAAQLSAQNGYSPSKKGKTKEEAPAPTRTAYPRKLEYASTNWKKLQEVLKMNDKSKPTDTGAQQKSKSMGVVRQTQPQQPATKKPDIWFDGVDPMLLEPEMGIAAKSKLTVSNGLVKHGSFNKPTRTVAMDCEMVGVGPEGKDSMLARVSIVNVMGHCIYDKFVKPMEEVVDYRTPVSGVRPKDLENAEEFSVVQKEVGELLEGRILVGHAVHHDLKVLFLSHPRRKIRDTSAYKPFRTMFGGRTPSLKRLSERILGVKVQEGEHSSVQDAQAAMRCYTLYKRQWEEDIRIGRQRVALQRTQAAEQS